MRERREKNQANRGIQISYATSTPSSISRILGKRKNLSPLPNQPTGTWPSSRRSPIIGKSEKFSKTSRTQASYNFQPDIDVKPDISNLPETSEVDKSMTENSESNKNQGMVCFLPYVCLILTSKITFSPKIN